MFKLNPKTCLRIVAHLAIVWAVTATAFAQSRPNHELLFGYYFADGRYGDFTSEVLETNLYIALPCGYDTALGCLPSALNENNVMEQGYRDILQRIKTETPRVRVHVQSVLPTRDNYAKHNANVVDFNGRLKKLAEEFGYDYLDIHALVADDKGELKDEYTGDGLHLNEAAYKVWLAEVERVMKW